jgi:hypothetical protein
LVTRALPGVGGDRVRRQPRSPPFCRLVARSERLLAEFAEEVVGAPAELAGDRQAGAGAAEPLGDLEVVAVVG